MTFFTFLLIGIALYGLFYIRTNDYLNPFGTSLLLWFTCAGISTLQLSVFEDPWSFDMYLTVLTSTLPIIAIGLFVTNRDFSNINSVVRYSFSIDSVVASRCFCFTLFLFIYCFVASMLEWGLNGYATLIDSVAFDAKGAYVGGSFILHAGTTLLPYCALLAIFQLVFLHSKRLFSIVSYLIIAYTFFYFVFVQISRGSLLIPILGTAYMLTRKYKITLKHLIFVAVLTIVFLIWMMSLRLDESSLVYHYTSYSPEFNVIYSYISSSFNNLNALIERGSNWTIFADTFPLFDQASNITENTSSMTAGVFNAMTWLRPFYIDLGMLGTMIYPSITFALIGWLYVKSRRNLAWIPLMAFCQKPILMISFSSYFSISGYNLFWILVGLFTAFALKSPSGKAETGKLRKPTVNHSDSNPFSIVRNYASKGSNRSIYSC